MTTPNHPGSRAVDQRPNLLRWLRILEARVSKLASQTRPETLVFAPSNPAQGVACTSATLVNTHVTLVYRSGNKVFADVSFGTGADAVMEGCLNVPGLTVVGDTAQSAPAGGTERIVRLTLTLPETWASGAAYPVYVQARRVSGAAATTVRILRAWQR